MSVATVVTGGMVPQDGSGLDSARIDLLKRSIASGAPDLEFELFVNVCKRTGLDPFAKQIYLIKRGGSWMWQTSIDGLRLIADRTGQYAGSDDPIFTEVPGASPFDPNSYPLAATVTVWKFVQGQRLPFTATARWREYVVHMPEYVNGQKTGRTVVGDFWRRMPYLMLGKCAEALALRKAFPANLSGLYVSEELGADEGEVIDVTPQQPQQQTAVTTTGTGWTQQPQQQTTSSSAPPAEAMASSNQVGNVKHLLKKLGDAVNPDSIFASRNVTKPEDLTGAQAKALIAELKEMVAAQDEAAKPPQQAAMPPSGTAPDPEPTPAEPDNMMEFAGDGDPQYQAVFDHSSGQYVVPATGEIVDPTSTGGPKGVVYDTWAPLVEAAESAAELREIMDGLKEANVDLAKHQDLAKLISSRTNRFALEQARKG